VIAHTLEITDTPSWLPEALRVRNRDIKVSVRFSEPERTIFQKKARIPVSRWAERYRMVTRGPLEGTRFRPITTPYLPASWTRPGSRCVLKSR
jgi:hypothetical protein